jgi:hypothetical protein
MAIKYTILHCKTLQNLTKLGFLVWKYTIWQPWRERVFIASAPWGKEWAAGGETNFHFDDSWWSPSGLRLIALYVNAFKDVGKQGLYIHNTYLYTYVHIYIFTYIWAALFQQRMFSEKEVWINRHCRRTVISFAQKMPICSQTHLVTLADNNHKGKGGGYFIHCKVRTYMYSRTFIAMLSTVRSIHVTYRSHTYMSHVLMSQRHTCTYVTRACIHVTCKHVIYVCDLQAYMYVTRAYICTCDMYRCMSHVYMYVTHMHKCTLQGAVTCMEHGYAMLSQHLSHLQT